MIQDRITTLSSRGASLRAAAEPDPYNHQLYTP